MGDFGSPPCSVSWEMLSFAVLQSHCLFFYYSGIGITHVLRIHLQAKHVGDFCRKSFHFFLTCFLLHRLYPLQFCLLGVAEIQCLSLRGTYQRQSCLISVESQLDIMPWNPANFNDLAGLNLR